MTEVRFPPPTGRPFGVEIEYYIEETPLGNAGALFKLWKSGKLGGLEENGSDFLLLNGDAVFHIDFNRFVAFHQSHGDWPHCLPIPTAILTTAG